MRKVMAFGTFDGVHEGHRAFFRQARLHGEQLIVAVAHDDVVMRLKDHLPRKDLERRMEDLSREDLVDFVTPGDSELGTYRVVRQYRPDVIALGYDQQRLKFNLEDSLRDIDWDMTILVMEPYQPETYHSSILSRL